MRALVIIVLLVSFGCGKKEQQPVNVLQSIQEMGELATVEYTVTKIIKAQDNKTWFKVGDRKILMTCEAVIKAGVDLSSITEQNFQIDGEAIRLTLPPPKVISLSLPPEKIEVKYEEVGMLRSSFNSSERDALARQAEQQIRGSIDSLGILLQAKANTAMLMNNMLRQLGYTQITIIHQGDKQPAVLP